MTRPCNGASSFCERIISAGNGIMTDGHTLLGHEELEWLILLRMNRKFMQFMRAHYPEVARGAPNQKFGRTVIPPSEPEGGVGGQEAGGWEAEYAEAEQHWGSATAHIEIEEI